MKALKINAKIKCDNGLSTNSGGIVIIAESYTDQKAIKDNLIPCQIVTFVYASLTAYQGGSDPVQQISDFNPIFRNLQLPVEDYQTIPAEILLIDTVEEYLDSIYPGKIEIINI